jgi:hypothetical protein
VLLLISSVRPLWLINPALTFWKTRSMIRKVRRPASSGSMSVRLGRNQYGKAETHLVRVFRDGDEHSLRDLLVSVALSGATRATRRSTTRASRCWRRSRGITRCRYGLIEGAVVRDGAPDPGPVWDPYPLITSRPG